MGSRDYRPTPEPHLHLPIHAPLRSPAKADGLFIENAHRVSFRDVTFEFEGDRTQHNWFGKCLDVDEYSTGIDGADQIRCINGPGKPKELPNNPRSWT